jgi:electron transfer flavoprotein alpha/beta subunit
VPAPSDEESKQSAPSDDEPGLLFLFGPGVSPSELGRGKRLAERVGGDWMVTWEGYGAGLAGIERVCGVGARARWKRGVVGFGLRGGLSDLSAVEPRVPLCGVGGTRSSPLFSKAVLGVEGEVAEVLREMEEACSSGDEEKSGSSELGGASEANDSSTANDTNETNGSAGTGQTSEAGGPEDKELLIMVLVGGPSGDEASQPELAPFDARAIRQAVALADRRKGAGSASVVAVCVGDERCEDPLGEAISLGATRAIRLWDDSLEKASYRGVARVLSQAAGKLEPSLVLAGARSARWGHGIVGPAMARRLGWPHLSGALRVELGHGERARVCRAARLARGEPEDRAWSTVELPAVLTVCGPRELGVESAASGATASRSTKDHGAEAARERVEAWDLEALQLSMVDLGPLCRLSGQIESLEPLKTVWVENGTELWKRLAAGWPSPSD